MPEIGEPLYLGAAPSNLAGAASGIGPLANVFIMDIVPAAAVNNCIAPSQSLAAAGSLSLSAGTSVTATISATYGTLYNFDVPRAVSVTSTANITARTIVVDGVDQYGQPMTESIAGPNNTTIAGRKAFKSIYQVYVDGAVTNIRIGSSSVLGLPIVIDDVAYVSSVRYGAISHQSATIVLSDATSPATSATGDVRGTILLGTALTGTTRLVVAFSLKDRFMGQNANRNIVLGVTQASPGGIIAPAPPPPVVTTYVFARIYQSNDAFFGLNYDSVLDAPSSRVDMWQGISALPNYGTITQYTLPQQAYSNSGLIPGRFGIGHALAFGKAFLQRPGIQPQDRVLIVECSVGATSAAPGGRWYPPSGNLYTNAVTQINAAMAAAENPILAGIISIGGEQAAYDHVVSGTYNPAYDSLLTSLRANVTGGTNVPILTVSMVPDWVADPSPSLGPTVADVNEIEQSNKTTIYRVPYTSYYVGPSGMTDADVPGQPALERIHYNAAALRLIGAALAGTPYDQALANTPASITAPTAPSIAAFPQTSTTALLQVTPPANMGSLILEYKLNSSGTWIDTNTGSVTSRTIAGLTNGALYDMRAATVNAAGTSSYTQISWTQLPLPTAPVLSISAMHATSADLSWSASANSPTDYLVEYKLSSSGTWLTFSHAPSTATTITVTGLATGFSYDFRVSGINVNGTGPASNTVSDVTGASPTISGQAWRLPGWGALTLSGAWSITGGAPTDVAINIRAGGTADPYLPATIVSRDSAGFVITADPTQSWDVQLAGDNTVTISWTGTPQPTVFFDIPNCTRNGSNEITSMPSIGTNTTAWTQSAGATAPLYDATTFAGKTVIGCGPSRRFNGIPLANTAYTDYVICRNVDFSGYGNYFASRGAVLNRAYWRNGFGTPGSQRDYITHVPPNSNLGPAPASTNLTASTWNGHCCAYDPALGSNQQSLYVNDTLGYQGNQSNRTGTEVGQNFNGYNDLANSGNYAYYMLAAQWHGTALSSAQIAQFGAAARTTYAITYG